MRYVYFYAYVDITGRWVQGSSYRVADMRRLARKVAKREVLASNFQVRRVRRVSRGYYNDCGRVMDWATVRVVGESVEVQS